MALYLISADLPRAKRLARFQGNSSGGKASKVWYRNHNLMPM